MEREFGSREIERRSPEVEVVGNLGCYLVLDERSERERTDEGSYVGSVETRTSLHPAELFCLISKVIKVYKGLANDRPRRHLSASHRKTRVR